MAKSTCTYEDMFVLRGDLQSPDQIIIIRSIFAAKECQCQRVYFGLLIYVHVNMIDLHLCPWSMVNVDVFRAQSNSERERESSFNFFKL